ncbi:unnamed protein product [Cyberlindnera jadinii]|uniref:Mitochondrial ribosomal protein of the small subunit n=1 Tax=Cyberlindnera jadinii (strain ATCC 18201 / CBS 1600 / BCRC 20928 / JCM 3617 / NBRC 0987 / NRRL Y-1542) TaxID=983966 RepID=A0A0H5C7U7_CYBJN|nr:mitochondrial ribosomal protein of the small subunit [Cyberlindnera jadinii NRRL Y-1542]ODV71443.1 mitochondrial ribosomal protein of the small subunit [Cyberlindnera jadinii NRRL Y-1542]CEP24375.1 unnamed protein product [Cyberlindnera jadinii]
MSSNRAAAVRLPKLERLRVKNSASEQQVSPCTVLMSSLLNCWSSNGEGSALCKELEQNLKGCMENRVRTKAARSSINYHTERLFPRINGKPHD